MSWRKKIKDKITGQKTYQITGLGDLGIDVVEIGTSQVRLEEQEKAFRGQTKAFQGPYSEVTYQMIASEAFDKLYEINQTMDLMVRNTALPWGQPLSNAAFSRIVRAYEEIMTITNYIFTTIEPLIKETEETSDPQKILDDYPELKTELEKNPEKKRKFMADLQSRLSAKANAIGGFVDKKQLIQQLKWFLQASPYHYQRFIASATWSKDQIKGKGYGVFDCFLFPGFLFCTRILSRFSLFHPKNEFSFSYGDKYARYL